MSGPRGLAHDPGASRADSDLDLAVLVAGHADPVLLCGLAGELADRVGCEVDLLDMRAASTVMQHQILSTGLRLWSADPLVGIGEAGALNDKLDLDQARAGLMRDIEREGRVTQALLLRDSAGQPGS